MIWIKLRCTRGNWPRFSLIEQGIAERRCPISTSPVPPTTPARCCLGATAPSQHGAIRSCTGSPNARPMATQSQKTMQGDKRTLSAIAAGLMTGGGGKVTAAGGAIYAATCSAPIVLAISPLLCVRRSSRSARWRGSRTSRPCTATKQRTPQEGTIRSHSDRHIGELLKQCQVRGEPAVSVDTKRKELVGDFASAGQEWQPENWP